jgi:hypothetical protein
MRRTWAFLSGVVCSNVLFSVGVGVDLHCFGPCCKKLCTCVAGRSSVIDHTVVKNKG